MKRLFPSIGLCLPLLVACQGPGALPPTSAEVEAQAIATSAIIQRGEVGNAISGTVEVPISLKALASLSDGAPPVTIHAFRTTGQLIREASVSVFWKNDQSIGYVVDGVPTDHVIVLAATIEPGIVLRALIPGASREQPARGQTINTTSETIVTEAYMAGLLPPVGLGGTAEVLRQGGLNPAAAAPLNLKAAESLRGLAAAPWAQGLPELTVAADALVALTDAQTKVAETLNAGASDNPALRALGGQVFRARLAADAKLNGLKARLEALSQTSAVPYDAAAALNTCASLLREAERKDMPGGTDVVPSSGTFHVAQVAQLPFPYRAAQPSTINLGQVYEDLKYIASSESGFTGPNGGPFTEQEIDEAFASGKGPYRKKCTKASFEGTNNCKVITNPADMSREVLITREADTLAQRMTELAAAFASRDEVTLKRLLTLQPALLNFIADDAARWQSPIGTWRLRLLQDTGEELGGPPGLAVLSDAEMYIQAPLDRKSKEDGALSSGAFNGLFAVWMPSLSLVQGEDVLNNFAVRFEWDNQARTLSDGELRGERRESYSEYSDNVNRSDYSASFEGRMTAPNRISGYWFNDERDMAGRFEMIRGTANYSI